MGVDINVRSELDSVAPFFSILAADQVPFAATETQKEATNAAWRAVRKSQPERYKLRNRGVISGIRRIFPKKRDYPNLRSGTGSIDAFQALQETGGVKRSARGGRLAVPTEAIRRGARGVRPSDLPSAKLRQKQVFVRELGDGRARIQRKRGRRRVLYRLVRKAVVEPAEPTIRDAATPAFVRKYRARLEPNLLMAVRTAGQKAKSRRRRRGRRRSA